jgi:hypothetical protein
MRGLKIRCDSFEALFAPILPEMRPLYWFTDFQAGPFDSLWCSSSPSAEQRLAEVFVHVPFLANTSASVWRPGTLPELASRIVWDEGALLVGFEAEGDWEATRWGRRFWFVDWLSREDATVDYLSLPFFRKIEQSAVVLILLLYQGLWEVYTPNERWFSVLGNHHTALTVESDHWKRGY